jgi:hypothetical protein
VTSLMSGPVMSQLLAHRRQAGLKSAESAKAL